MPIVIEKPKTIPFTEKLLRQCGFEIHHFDVLNKLKGYWLKLPLKMYNGETWAYGAGIEGGIFIISLIPDSNTKFKYLHEFQAHYKKKMGMDLIIRK